MFKVFLGILVIGLVGCAGADIVKVIDQPKKGGVVRYKNGNFVREKSRALAITEINEYCGGPFSIEKEEFNPDVFSLNVGGTYFTPNKDNFMFIKFNCEK